MFIFICLVLSLVAAQDVWIRVTFNDMNYIVLNSELTVGKLKAIFSISEIDYLEDLSGKIFYASFEGRFEYLISKEVFVRQKLPNKLPTIFNNTESKFITNTGNADSKWLYTEVGYYAPSKNIRLAYIQFKNETLTKSPRKISKAYLRLYGGFHDSSLPVQVFVHRCDSDWRVDINWYQYPSYNHQPYSSLIIGDVNGVHYLWDVTGLVLDWNKGIFPNYGFTLKTNNTVGVPSTKGFYNTDPDKKPSLLVYYSD